VLHHEVSQHAGADVDPAEQASADQRQQRPSEPLVAFVYQAIERLVDGTVGSAGLIGAQQPTSGAANGTERWTHRYVIIAQP